MGGMAFHAAEFMALALTARDRAAEARRLDSSSMPPDALVSIVMAAAAAEAFINELGAYYRLGTTLQPAELACGEALAEVERGQGSTQLKFLLASLTLSGHMFEKGSKPFQDFSKLMTVRNSLMHPKPLDQFSDSGVMEPPAWMRDFEQRGLVALYASASRLCRLVWLLGWLLLGCISCLLQAIPLKVKPRTSPRVVAAKWMGGGAVRLGSVTSGICCSVADGHTGTVGVRCLPVE
jgi:hypothetical protein